MTRHYVPEEYDAKGQLRLPFLFWLILLLQARTWLLLVMAGASRQQGNDLLALFYPDRQSFWLGLGLGIPALLGLLLTGYRQRWPHVWQRWRYVLSLSLLLSLLWQGAALLSGALTDSPLPLLLTLFDPLRYAGYTSINDCVIAFCHNISTSNKLFTGLSLQQACPLAPKIKEIS